MKGNRYGVTLRFNLAERETLRNMSAFWQLDEKQVLKLAFEQLATSTQQLNSKLLKEQEDAKGNTDTGSAAAGDNAGPVDTNTEATAADTSAA